MRSHVIFSERGGSRAARGFSGRASQAPRRGHAVLVHKFEASVAAQFPERQRAAIEALFARKDVESVPVNEFMASLVAN